MDPEDGAVKAKKIEYDEDADRGKSGDDLDKHYEPIQSDIAHAKRDIVVYDGKRRMGKRETFSNVKKERFMVKSMPVPPNVILIFPK